MDTLTLVRKSKQGDISAFTELIREKHELLYKISFAYTKNQYDAQDCLSEACIKGFDKIRQLKNEEKFYSWFTSLLINICRKQYREKSKISSDEDLGDIMDMFSFSTVDDRIIIENLLDKLKDDEREIVVLKYLKDYPLKEVARIIGLPENTVKTKIYRSINFLKSRIGRLKNEY